MKETSVVKRTKGKQVGEPSQTDEREELTADPSPLREIE